MTKNNYSLYNSYNAEFGRVGQYFANKAVKDMETVMDSGATQDVIDDVVKRAINSGEKQVTQKAQRFGKKARRLWKTSPKLRRNVKLAGVAGAGLLGLNTLTGLKTVYDIGKGIKNKFTPKRQLNAKYSLFNTQVVEFAQNKNKISELRKNIANSIYKEEPKKESELKRWGRAGALMGTGAVVMPVGAVVGGVASSLPMLRKYNQLGKVQGGSYKLSTDLKLRNISKKLNRNTRKRIASGAVIGSGLGAVGAYATYRGGKTIINKLRGKKEEKK